MADSLTGLEPLLPEVAAWFRDDLGEPTTPQRAAWPLIASGQHTLIAAPTGSGKTLAGFLACLDYLWRHPNRPRGVGVLYVSPLKALNQDIARNLERPLEGILATSKRLGRPLPSLSVAVRTGDTPPHERRRLVTRPPDVLITTPESLHLILTSKARETLRHVRYVLIDEVHALCPNKRGVFLALLLERLQALQPDAEFQRIGMSATQRPLDEVARYLGGLRSVAGKKKGPTRFEPRPVAIVDAGVRKNLDLQVVTPVPLGGPLPGKSVWPHIENRLYEWINEHRSTIVFANNRRVVERLTSHLNARAEGDNEDAEPVARSHHGSLSLEQRRQTEAMLKQGELPAVVATASLELGIDMGAVDLVAQVESPGGVARGLQRVGRAGHIVGAPSKGRLIAKTCGDLLEMAALARAMTLGEVEALRVPRDCLDVLAQQIVACVAMDRWDVPALFDLVRSTYPYHQLPAEVFERVLEMVSGRFGMETFRDLRPRVSWDRVHNKLHSLPGSAQLALVGGGAIPDTGHYPLYLGDPEGPRLGELDEEFVLERRVGETFVLGTTTWKIESIDPQRVVVSRAEGRSALVPFWRGESTGRTPELGRAVGELSRGLSERPDDPRLLRWLIEEYHLDERAAVNLRDYVARQRRQAGCVPDDRTVLVESFVDPAGETGLAVLTPFGSKLHQALKLALQAQLRRRLGVSVACLYDDEAVLIRLPGTDEPPLDLFRGLTGELAESLIREELPDSPLFGLRFRQNAGRALLMPRPDPGKRTPLWLQRLRAKDLLQVVRQVPDFPIVVETLRECLNDDLDLPGLRAFLNKIETGEVRVVMRQGQVPSPFLSEVLLKFTLTYLYEWDEPRRGDVPKGPGVDRGLIDSLLRPEDHARWLDPGAIGRVDDRLRGVGRPPRTADEMAEWLRRVGDLTDSELAGPMMGFLSGLEAQGRATTIVLPGTIEPRRWVLIEEKPIYEAAFGVNGPCGTDTSVCATAAPAQTGVSVPQGPPTRSNSAESIVRRFVESRALVGLDDLTARYPIDQADAIDLLERWADAGRVVALPGDDGPRWADRRNLDEMRRLSVALQRRESVAVTPEAFAEFLARLHGIHPDTRREGAAAVRSTLELLEGFAGPIDLWESDLLPRRVRDHRRAWLDEELASGAWTWRASSDLVAFAGRGFEGHWPASENEITETGARAILDHLRSRGASFTHELAQAAGLPPSRVRLALDALARVGVVTNDRLDPMREGGAATTLALAEAGARAAGTASGRPRLGGLRRGRNDRLEGRWSLIPPSSGDSEASCLAWAEVLLGRYGVLCRETHALEAWAPPWRDLLPWLDRAEMRGEVRRGYFVEGASGIQYATAEAADELARLFGRRTASDVPYMISTLDPANVYGSGAPFDVPLLEGGTVRLARSAGNSLVLVGGRPVLIVEAYGRRLTGLASASQDELAAAVALLPTLAGPSRRVLKVETYNGEPAATCAATAWLTEAGLVRDPPGMAYYAGW
jgi:ATP-dependent Lhr-like helicase